MWFEWLFKYPRQAYAQGELAFAGDFGAPWWGAVVVLLTLGIVFGRRVARFTIPRRATVYLLQIAAIGVLLTIIAEPVLEVTRLAPGANTVAVLVDSSESMSLPARAANDETRLAVAKRLVGNEIEAASGGSQVALFHFGDTLRQADTVADVQADGVRSRLLESLADLATHYDQGALAAVIVVTDGALNGRRVGWETLAETGIPVHSIGIGPADIPGDVELAELVLPSRASPHTQVAASLVIRHSSRDSGEIRLRVLDGESVLAAESITLDPSSTTVTTDIVFPSGGSGLKEVTVALEALPGDPLPGNNVQSVLLDVDRERYRVLYLEGEPRWEFKFIRRATAEDDDIELVTWLRTTPRKTYRQGTADPDELADGFPSSLEALYRYDMVIIGSLPATSLNDEQHDWLARFVAERGGGLLAIAGRHALDNGGWDVKPLAQALPVMISRPGEGSYGRRNYRVRPTDDGLRSVLTDIGSTGTREEAWGSLPMLADYQHLGTPKPGATVILEASGGVEQRGADVVVRGSPAKPLLVTQPYGFGRTAVLATASTWRWRMRTPPEDTRHSLFWRHLIRHFAGAALPRRDLSLAADGDALDVRVALKNPRFEPLTDTAVTVQVTSPDGESFEVALPRIPGEPAFGETIPATKPGIYRVEMAGLAGPAPLSEGGRPDALAALARVGEANLEQFGATLNEPLLRRVAEVTGGRYWRPDDLSGLADALAFSSAGIHERQQLPLWNAPFLFVLLVLLKCTEWSLRRYWGGI